MTKGANLLPWINFQLIIIQINSKIPEIPRNLLFPLALKFHAENPLKL